MSDRLPMISGREMIRLLERDGFSRTSQRGDHVKMTHSERGNVTIVPDHRELRRGTLKAILQQAGWTVADLRTVAARGVSAATASFRESRNAAERRPQRGPATGRPPGAPRGVPSSPREIG